MAEVVPRWEWRTFGRSLEPAERFFASRSPERVQESDELYLLSSRGGDTVKVRDDLMDVKHLVEVSEDGLEQWAPVMKAPFPMPVRDVRSMLAAMLVDPAVPLTRDSYTLDQLLDEVVGPSPELGGVRVHKRRERFTIGGCMTELTDVRADGATTRTVAIEAEDPHAVLATVREIGLGSYPNTSFPRGLRELLATTDATTGPRYAVIDVGTNSVKFHIGEREADGGWRRVVDRAEPTRLGEGLHETGRLNPDPIRRTVEAIAEMAEQARQHDAVAVVAVGTAGLRMAPNAADLLDAAAARSGVTIEIISGEEEGRLAYLAAKAGLGGLADGAVVVFDTGGGSSQLTFGHGDRVDEQFSVPVGAVRFTERYGLAGVVSEAGLTAALEAIDADLSRLDGRPAPDAVVGMGGGVTNLAAVKLGLTRYDPDQVQGTALRRDDIDEQIELFRTRDTSQRAEIVGLQPQRADIILAGACIVRTILTKLRAESFTVSDRGLRHGLLVDRFG
jgi:exopolyphosphatase/guanosine-5'-triphosphate,3'-diphosphate pyrophosphatase